MLYSQGVPMKSEEREKEGELKNNC